MIDRNQSDIKRGWKTKDPVVSICCITYNHEEYIEEALDRFLMQETEFPFEIVIHDDASTDKTAEIIREYEKRFPDLFNPLYQTENQKSRIGSGMNPRFNFPRTKGKYIAMCDGDDYWTDPLKLQKQVEFMEGHPEYSMCFHNYNKQEKNKIIKRDGYNYQSDYSLADLAGLNPAIQTSTVLFKSNFVKANSKKVWDKRTGSRFLFIQLAEKGKIRYLPETMSVYRVHERGVWSGKSTVEQALMTLKNIEAMMEYFVNNKKIKKILKKKYFKKTFIYARRFIFSFDIKGLFYFLKKNYKNLFFNSIK